MKSKENLRVLLVTSRPLSHSAGLGKDIRDALERLGCQVDTMTTEDYVEDSDNDMLPIKYKQSRKCRLLRFFDRFAKRRRRFDYISNNGVLIVTPVEKKPFVTSSQIEETLRGRTYDFVFTIFWQDMITSDSLTTIYEVLNVPIIVYMVDMTPVTGGCIYPNNCIRYKEQCGKCPGLVSSDSNDQSHKNWLVKKQNYDNIEIAMLCNSWQRNLISQTGLVRGDCLFLSSIILNHDRFVPMSRTYCQRYFGISPSVKCVFLARATKEAFKGFSKLVVSVNDFFDKLPPSEQRDVLLVLIGENDPWYENVIHMPVLNLGFLNQDQLIRVYSAVDVFLSPSISDAGPSMVNQSQMCGIPTISFNIGTAMDVVENKKNGYVARNFDCDDFAQGLRWYYKTSQQERIEIKKTCREKAMSANSSEIFAKNVLGVFYEISRRKH
ncbi:glycosyltransferase [bacterium]|nr:glycosyltransferase [bacterium]